MHCFESRGLVQSGPSGFVGFYWFVHSSAEKETFGVLEKLAKQDFSINLILPCFFEKSIFSEIQ